MARPEVRRQIIRSEVRAPRGHAEPVKIAIFDNRSIVEETRQEELPADALPTLTLFGYGHNARSTRAGIEWMGREGHYAVGVIMPFNQLTAHERAIEAGARQMPHAVADHLREEANMPDTPLRYIGQSQGGGIWGLAANERPDGFGDTVLIQPVGIRCEKFVATTDPKVLRRDFLRRFMENARIQDLRDPETYLAGLNIGGQFVIDIATGRLTHKLNCALKGAMQTTIIEHRKSKKNLLLVLGTNDGVFPRAEIEDALGKVAEYDQYRPEIVIVDGASHAAPASREGKLLIKEAIQGLDRFAQG